MVILASFTEDRAAFGLSELSRALRMSKATLLRILWTLSHHGIVRQREEDRAFVLGPELVRLGTLALNHSGLLEVCRRHLRRLQALTEETVCLFVRTGRDRLCVDVAPSQHELRITINVGATRPLHAGAAGKVLLAFMPEDEARRIVCGRPLEAITERTLTDGMQLLRQLKDIRARRVAVSEGEAVRGAAAIATPILDKDGGVVAAVNVLGPRLHLTPARIHRLIPAVVAAAETMSEELGHISRPMRKTARRSSET
ncbi:MAG: IclR family transcriptional regulator [Candidatus Rokubacteria bacterium]|nr:IclR family transcriptional regulator [Candidatus Rokubacteria bacterium]